jgi:hypothetical protein
MPRAVLAVVGRMTFSGGAGKTGTNPVGAPPPKDSKDGQKAETSAAEVPAPTSCRWRLRSSRFL